MTSMATPRVTVQAPNVTYTSDKITSQIDYCSYQVSSETGGQTIISPQTTSLVFETSCKVPKLGLMMVGWGGNNGTTLTGGILANKLQLSWKTRRGLQKANFFGSLTQSSTLRIGANKDGSDAYAPFSALVPLVDPRDIALGGWDINSMDMASAMDRAGVMEPELKAQLSPLMQGLKPMPSIFDPEFVALNQSARADNVLTGTKSQKLEQIRSDIRHFKEANQCQKIVVLWIATTERFSEVDDRHASWEQLKKAIDGDLPEISPSVLFAVAAILEGCPFINGSPQNTFIPGVLELAEQKSVPIMGDDLKTGQTKLKSALVEYLIGTGLKVASIASYNHLGNNDGYNLSSPQQFRSKEVTKSSVVDDMVTSNTILYPGAEKPDHVVVIKYVPFVGDSKRALDEYTSEIFLGGLNTMVIHNTCEDSLLAAPIMLDLVVMIEFLSRVQVLSKGSDGKPGVPYPPQPVTSLLSFFLKAPLTPKGAPVVNALQRQKAAIENFIRACIGLSPESYLALETRYMMPGKP